MGVDPELGKGGRSSVAVSDAKQCRSPAEQGAVSGVGRRRKERVSERGRREREREVRGEGQGKGIRTENQ